MKNLYRIKNVKVSLNLAFSILSNISEIVNIFRFQSKIINFYVQDLKDIQVCLLNYVWI